MASPLERSPRLRIGIVGTGRLGGALGTLFALRGHEVVFGTRDAAKPEVVKLVAKAGRTARTASPQDALFGSQVAILAVPPDVALDLVARSPPEGGRILVDATNRLGPRPPGAAASVAQDLAKLAPEARVVKAFNTLGAEHFANPRFGGVKASAFLCGDDAYARSVVASLAHEIGLDPVDCGSLAHAPLLEAMAILWIRLAQAQGRNFAFALLKR